MGNSTLTLERAYDLVCVSGVFDPRQDPSGYSEVKLLELGNNVNADLITERFNWKWNRMTLAPFLTNSWQQDYPQLPQATAAVPAWGEDSDIVDINNTVIPKPLWSLTWRRGLSRTSMNTWRPKQICWMYNKDLSLGVWPGANVTYVPLLGTNAPTAQNPIMNMTDANGNILIVTGFGTTGSVAPQLSASSAAGTTVVDGTVTWTCVDPNGIGFRLDVLPSSTGPTYQVIPYAQLEPPLFTTLQQTIDPIPDAYRRHFLRLLTAECQMASPDPTQFKKGMDLKGLALKAIVDAMKQGDKEPNAYGLLPLTQIVEKRWDEGYGPYTADQPY